MEGGAAASTAAQVGLQPLLVLPNLLPQLSYQQCIVAARAGQPIFIFAQHAIKCDIHWMSPRRTYNSRMI